MSHPTELPLVAISMKTYNRAAYLEKALDSLLAQTYKNFVLIISDNASPDGTQKLCEDLAKKDPRVRYIRQKENIGIFPNFNFTIRAAVAAADYCLLVSDDDLWEPTFLEKCMDALLKDPEAIVAFTEFGELFYGNGTVRRYDPKKLFPFEKDVYGRLKHYISFYSVEGKAAALFGVFRKRALEHEVMGSYYEHDVSFLLRCLSRGPCLFIEELLFYKGTLPGRESTKDQPMTVLRIVVSIRNRFERIGTEVRNMRFILTLDELTPFQKTKLVGWNILMIGRLFVERRT